MPKNAAYLLVDLLQEWAVPPNKTPEQHRGFGAGDDLAAWRRHHEAAALVRSVDHLIQGMETNGEDVEMFVPYLPAWYAGIHYARTPWSTRVGNSTAQLCSKSEIDMLRALARLIDTGRPVNVTEEDRRALLDTLAEARSLVDEDDDIPEDVRRYLLGLIVRAHMIVENLDKYGNEAVRQLALELGGALNVQGTRVAAGGDAPRANRFQTVAWSLVAGFAGGTGEGAAPAAIEAAKHGAKMITGN